MITQHTDRFGPVFFRHDALNFPKIRHGFFTRKGGVSTGLYDSLNCGPDSDDKWGAAQTNRARAAMAVNLLASHIAGLEQTHSATCMTLVRPGPYNGETVQGDAYVTTMRGSGLAILTADCLPILFCDAEARIIGAAHAGWRGAASGLIETTVAAMKLIGAKPDRIVMVIGPGIRQPSYQVSDAMRAEITGKYETASPCFTADPAAPDKWLFDLPGFAIQRGQAAGLTQIHDCGLDSYADDTLFFSHRRATHKGEPDTGRMITLIAQD